MTTSRPTTPASPKLLRVREPEHGVPMYGCEHIQRLLTKNQEVTTSTIHHYKMLLRVVFDTTPVISQTSKAPEGRPITSLTPNYLCLQCPTTTTKADRNEHGKLKAHMFYVDSQCGSLFCSMCDDTVYDPTLEALRVAKTGSFNSRKRKLDELFTEAVKEDPKYISMNTVAAPCRANGLRGIHNMGSTCFMSVILQSFVHNPLLRNFFLSDGHQTGDCTREHCMNCVMDDLFQDFYAQDKIDGFSASNVLHNSWACRQAAFASLAGYEEQDAHEFFQFLAQELHRTNKADNGQNNIDDDAIGGKSDELCNCIIHQTFYGKSQSTVTCQNCDGITTSVEPFLDLSLGLNNMARKRQKQNGVKQRPLTLQRCLDEEYKRPERCEYTCQTCNGPQDARKQLSIKRLPNVLCVQFKRFEHLKDSGNTTKIDLKVQFPLQINMLPYTNRARVQDTRDNFELARSCTYDLLSVVVHVGTIDTGHYISYSRVGTQWFKFDDHKVTLATESQVLGAEAFILYYIIRSLA